MNNLLFFTFNELQSSEGIAKKIEYQRDAFKENGYNVNLMHTKLEGSHISLFIDNEKIASYKNNYFWLFKLNSYKCIIEYIEKHDIKYVYARYTHYASLKTNALFKELKKRGIKIILEIPTYPYDEEYKGFKQKIFLSYEKVWRKQLAKHLDYIATFTQLESIWGIPTINIKNGVDFSKIKTRLKNNPINNKIELIAVASISFWHGIDRIIEGMNIYFQTPIRETDVHFSIVGKGDINVYNSLVELVKKYNLQDHVTFYGAQHGEELDKLFEKADLAIGCLGCHRKGIKEVSSLKNVEYAARGIPFIYSEINRDFDNMFYVKKITPDESPVNIKELVKWRKAFNIQPNIIRESVVESLSWEKQMKKIADAF